jgi:hypothetical protein
MGCVIEDLIVAEDMTAWRPTATAHPIQDMTAMTANDGICRHTSCFVRQWVKVANDGMTAFFYFFAGARASLFFVGIFYVCQTILKCRHAVISRVNLLINKHRSVTAYAVIGCHWPSSNGEGSA